MLQNLKLRTVITTAVSGITAICIGFLFIVANHNMTTAMKDSAMDSMKMSLEAKGKIVEEFVVNSEKLLTAYSKAPIVAAYLKEPDNQKLFEEAQRYTENFYSGLDNWEGIYIAEWNSHVITHSNAATVGITTREGKLLKALQDSMTNGLYDAGIIVSPATKKLILSMYCPVYDTDGKTVLGYVGGGVFAEELKRLTRYVECR